MFLQDLGHIFCKYWQHARNAAALWSLRSSDLGFSYRETPWIWKASERWGGRTTAPLALQKRHPSSAFPPAQIGGS